MSIEIKGLRNYSATVIRVPKVGKVPNSDRLHFFHTLGIQVIVDESWVAREGELALLFPAEVQLGHEFAAGNGLYRQSLELNKNRGDSGYLEANRRVRTLKLRGNISNGLALPLKSLGPVMEKANVDWSTCMFEEGMVFDTFAGIEICRKYTVPVKDNGQSNKVDARKRKAFKRVDTTYLPEHYDTGQWLREQHTVEPHEEVIITQKLHGTSVRLANTVVKRQLKWYERLAQRLGVQVTDHNYDLVAGSKKVIKDPNNPNQQHFYGK